MVSMMQEPSTLSPVGVRLWDILPDQSLVALLALVGTRRVGVEDLRARTRLTPSSFGGLMEWLQREHLVDVVSALAGGQAEEQVVELTEKGEAVLLGMLERTCELPELR